MFSFVKAERLLFNFNSLLNFFPVVLGDDFYTYCVFRVYVVPCLAVVLGLE